MNRLSGFGLLFCTAMMFQGSAAIAGFEFKGAAPVPAQESAPATAPVPLVSAEQTVIAPGPDEAVDTKALLEATVSGAPVALAPAAKPAPSNNGQLVINPYPLDESAGAKGATLGAVPLEQAMMEKSGNLRPVALPGTEQDQGISTRARIISRRDNASGYLPRNGGVAPVEAVPADVTMTPIPGGEGQPLAAIPGRVVPAMPAEPAPVAAAPAVTAPMATAPAAQEPQKFTDAVGFGKNLPLALALTQVVPPEYSYAFSGNVNASTNVSWEGGKPWNVVLNDMLAPSGLKAVIQGHQIVIAAQNS